MSFYPARYFRKLEGGKIECILCPRKCKLKEGQRGLCFVRGREKDQMVLYTYGRASGFCIDPIEKKPLNHFLPGSPVLSFGTAGCNLFCKFCQNWSISKSREMDILAEEAPPQKIAEVCSIYSIPSVAFTYNDPVIFLEYAVDTAIECHKRGIKTVAVSAGYILSPAREEFFSYMDAANIDLKGFTQKFYRNLTSGDLNVVLDTLVYIREKTSVWLEITNLLIPGHNDSSKEIRAMCKWIYQNLGEDVPIHFTAFHPDFKMLDTPPTPFSTLKKAYEIAKEEGLLYPYTGNIPDEKTQSTYCPQCKKKVISRRGYNILSYHIKEGKCVFCSYPISGVFLNQVGDWGAKRIPIRIT